MKTKRNLILILIVTGIIASSCEGLLGDLLKFNSQWYSFEFTIEPAEGPGEVVFKTEEFEADVDSVLDANGVARDNISSATLSDAKISILTSGFNFDPIEKVELFVETPNLGSRKIAWADSIPLGDTVVSLELYQDDLQEFLLESSFKLTASGVLKSRVDQQVDLKADIRWLIKGKLEATP